MSYTFSISLTNDYRAGIQECNSLLPCETFDGSHKEIWIYLSVKCLRLNFSTRASVCRWIWTSPC